MKHSPRVVVLVLGVLARSAFAQVPPAAPPPAAPAAPAPSEPPPAPAPPEPPAPAPAEPRSEDASSAAPSAEPAVPDRALTLDSLVLSAANRIDINFFGDVSLIQVRHGNGEFEIGPLGIQATAHLADRLSGRTEWITKFKNAQTVVDLERLYLEYRTERWAIEAGRTHAELGYWNTAFHHGTWLQLTIRRPRVLDFEEGGGILETHSIGLTGVYGPKRGDHGVEFLVSVGNGRGRTIDAVQNTGDNNWAKSVLLRISSVGIGHPALRFGMNAQFDKIAPEDAAVRPLLPNRSIYEFVTGVFLALRSERLIVYSETYNIVHRAAGQTWQFTDGFLLAGVRFGQFVPYGEFEMRRGDGFTDPYYRPDVMTTGSLSVPPDGFREVTAGIRYDASAWSALKLELAGARFQHSQDDYRVELNWSFGR